MISAYETGRRVPKLNTVIRLSKALGVPFGVIDNSFITSPPQRLKYLRSVAGFTQEELSKKMSVSVDTIAAWENGNRTISYAELDKLMGLLGLDASDYIDGWEAGINPGIFKPFLVPGSAEETLNSAINDLMPESYSVYYDKTDETYYIEYPDNFILKSNRAEFSKIIDSSKDYTAFQLEQLKSSYIKSIKE